ncbi:hypothetical protein O181_100394 [Austropuccinia psidii MF-1]|uniref:Uncharacterized protein n=1 Tax=Austropuccinia psidii MF-1 TaxID=1389203 RepID=A0A9Q3JF51_9BASI|nr:hypothetical protein [Austropuccinia psidii MF-1]
MRNHKLLTKLPGDLDNEFKCRLSKELTLDEISNTFQEVRMRTSTGRYYTHSTGDNRENSTPVAQKTHESDSEISTGFKSCESTNQYAERTPKHREEIFARKEESHESDSDSVVNGCGNESYSETSPNEEYLVDFKSHERNKTGSINLNKRKPMTKNLDGLKCKPPDSHRLPNGKLLSQG